MTAKWLLRFLRLPGIALSVSLTISACDKSVSSKDAVDKPQVMTVVGAPESKPKLFECPVPAFMRDRVAVIQIKANLAGEPTAEPWSGLFQSAHLDIKLSSGRVARLEVEDFFFFSTAPGRHEACEKFVFREVAGRIFFDYIFGNGNPYPPQVVKYLDEDAGEFFSTDNMFKDADAAFLDFDKKGCVSAVIAREPVKAYVCFRDGRYTWVRKRLDFSSQQKYYSFDCNLTQNPAAVLDAKVTTQAQPDGLSGSAPIDAIVRMEKMCEDFRKSHGERDIPGKTRPVISPEAGSPSRPIQKDADSVPQVTDTAVTSKIEQ